MKRRKFIQNSSLALGSIGMPWLFPSGLLNLAGKEQQIKHVVFCLFGGGIRNMESVHQLEGNLMPNTLIGSGSITKDISYGMEELPLAMDTPLQKFGTLYKEFRYDSFQTNHYNGHVTAITGHYTPYAKLMQAPDYPTVFEYYRKHKGIDSSLNAWWISDELGPFPYLNYSRHQEYGAMYGANCISPEFTFKKSHLSNKSFDEQQEQIISDLRSFFNRSFQSPDQNIFQNPASNQLQYRRFIETEIAKFINPDESVVSDRFDIASELVNLDILNVYAAARVLEEFSPELLVVNMQESDIGHSKFTMYCNNLRKADFALARLWKEIQSNPKTKDRTLLIATPEHGRNLEPNTIVDEFGRYAIDHTGDQTSREIFCLVLGPSDVVHQDQVIDKVAGESIDVVPTIAKVLGFEHKIPLGMLKGRPLTEALKIS